MSKVKARPREEYVTRILNHVGQPTHTSSEPSLLLTVGLPGSGKSTFCRRVAKETGAAILESDSLRQALFGSPSYSSQESKQLFSSLHEAARHLIKSGADVIIDATNLREADRRPAYALAAESKTRLYTLRFYAAEQVIAERLARRENGGDPEDNSTAGMAVFRRLAETEEPLPSEHISIDTSDPIATEAALRWVVEAVLQKDGVETGGSVS